MIANSETREPTSSEVASVRRQTGAVVPDSAATVDHAGWISSEGYDASSSRI